MAKSLKDQILLTISHESTPYKGYLIRYNPFLDSGPSGPESWWIEKDKFHISYAKSFDDAKRIVDELI